MARNRSSSSTYASNTTSGNNGSAKNGASRSDTSRNTSSNGSRSSSSGSSYAGNSSNASISSSAAGSDIDYESVVESCHTAFQDCQKVLSACFSGSTEVEPEHIRLFVDGSLVIGTCAELAMREMPVYQGIVHATAEYAKACEEACEEYEGETAFDSATESFRSLYETCSGIVGNQLPGWDAEGIQSGESRRGGSGGRAGSESDEELEESESYATGTKASGPNGSNRGGNRNNRNQRSSTQSKNSRGRTIET